MLNKYFNREEFTCKCGCGFSTVDAELLEVLLDIRETFEASVTISSGCRCREYNDNIQRHVDKYYIAFSSKSKHMEGIAADIRCSGISPSGLYEYLDRRYPDNYGVGKYTTFTHIDVRSNKARWGE